MSKETGTVVFPESFGFCEGVAAADDLLEQVAAEAHANGIDTIYGYHEIVHNKDVVRRHEANGVVFVDDLADIPPKSVVVTSAHGVGPDVVHALRERGATVFDAACPLVLHTHRGVEKARKEGEKVLYICHGKPGEVAKLHDEVVGMQAHLDYRLDEDGTLVEDPVERAYLELNEELDGTDLLNENGKYRIITQTTLHAEGCLSYRERIKEYILTQQPDARIEWSKPGEVCFAVADRQRGVEQMVELKPRRIVVATDPGSKNGMGYVALAKTLVAEHGLDTEVHAVANAEQAAQIDATEGVTALTASASTPDIVTFAVARALGMDEAPPTERKKFNLRDAREELLKVKISGHAAKIAGTAS